MEGKSQKMKALLGKRKVPAKVDRQAPKPYKKGKPTSNGSKDNAKNNRNGQSDPARGKNKKENQPQEDKIKKRYNPEEDEIDSDEIDSASEGEAGAVDELNHLDEESEERKRVRLAQQILKQTRIQIEGQDDDSFDDGEDNNEKDEKDNFKGVIHAENKHANAVTKALQNEILKKRQLIYTLFAEKVNKEWIKNTPSELLAKSSILKGHTRCITALEFTPDGKYLFSASKDASIIRWDIFNADPKLKKVFLVRERTPDAHKDEILGMSINHLSNYLVTCSKDKTIKLWDIKKMQLVQTFAGHKSAVQGIKFGINSNTFCSVSADRTFKMWDATEKAFIDTFFGHKSESTSIDAVNGDTFVSSGFDRQVILWKTGHQSQLIYSGHDYSIDVVKAVDGDHFITGSQDGSIALWSSKKKKPIFVLKNAHSGQWITAIGHLFNTDLFFSGSSDGFIHAYQINLQQHNFTKIFSIPANGVINDIQLSLDCSLLTYSECEEHRLGRWIVDTKAKNIIKCVKLL